MRNHEAVEKIHEERINQDWRHKVKIADCYVQLTEMFIEMFSDFQLMWDAHLGCKNIEKTLLDLSPTDARRIR